MSSSPTEQRETRLNNASISRSFFFCHFALVSWDFFVNEPRRCRFGSNYLQLNFHSSTDVVQFFHNVVYNEVSTYKDMGTWCRKIYIESYQCGSYISPCFTIFRFRKRLSIFKRGYPRIEYVIRYKVPNSLKKLFWRPLRFLYRFTYCNWKRFYIRWHEYLFGMNLLLLYKSLYHSVRWLCYLE